MGRSTNQFIISYACEKRKTRAVRKVFSFIIGAFVLALTHCSGKPHLTLLPGEISRDPSSVGVVALAAPKNSDEEEEESPGQFHALRDQGIQYYKSGDLTRAAHHLATAFLVHPESEELWPRYLLFYCLMSTGDYRSAQQVAEEIVKRRPYSAVSFQQVGMTQLWLGNPSEALKSFQRALEFASHSPRVHFYIGLAQGLLRQTAARSKAFGDAEAEYLQILKSNPNDFNANYELGALYLYWNRNLEEVPKLLVKAKEGLNQGTEQDLIDRRLYLQFYLPLLEGVYLQKKGVTKASLHALFTALTNAPAGVRPDIAEIFYFIARNYLDSKQNQNAQGFLEKGLTLDPSGPYANEFRGLIRELASRGNTSP